ncbi:alpha-mannosidase [Flavipsychrobacter stenotrophus]|uniref:Alpha-mannosidase n=1 Tax=Flavipsychrobacter stenotrophus TaxID=2077091 RepID=A0A2S7STL3_9BACT|nr:GH92 family glycosyl hydrolase [Flavipsychrobacter stenotrophus]PQJ09961.1 alpha-mannosidase [Flavipsychrobacter stenotrophus]
MVNKLKKVSILFALALSSYAQAQNLTKYIDPMIGTGGHGHTYPGATVPFGMVQLSPDNGDEGWDWCSGYNYSSPAIAGFSHMHLSGTGCGDWTDISVMPHTSLIADSFRFFKVPFDHKNEQASAGFYSVAMNNGVKVSLTTTERVGFHKYEFPKGSTPFVRFQLNYMINWDSTVKTRILLLNDSTVVGYRYSYGWANVERVYFAARVNRSIKNLHIFECRTHGEIKQIDETGKDYNGELEFTDLNGQPLMMKVALSSVSYDKALEALREIKGWDFEAYKKKAEMMWEHELEKTVVKTNDEHLKRIFYTAVYHTCLAPVLYSDADGYYKNAKDNVRRMRKGQRYTVFSLWDTFRGLNPLFTLTQPTRNIDILNSMLAFYEENGLLPVWDLSTFETNCMSGYHAVPVLADAVLKDTKGLDANLVFEAMLASANQKERGTQDYIKYGYLPSDKGSFSVTLTVEYAYDDWCIAQVAKKLGKMDLYATFMKRADSWKQLFDAKTGFMRGKKANGTWVTPFDPYFASTDWRTSNYEEGNAWQYTFFVPHDIQGLANAFGGNDAFLLKLDSLFSVNSNIKGESAPPDMSGLIGQYAHGNEPSHHIAYMYNFVGQPWKTQERVRNIIETMYHDQPEGYAGNEDCGQMSAWAVWSMMGFFPANPANGEYVFGSPVFDDLSLKLPSGKTMQIKTKNNSKANMYIQGITLNGKPYSKTYISHADLLKGGVLEFTMGDKPNKKWGIETNNWPSTALK